MTEHYKGYTVTLEYDRDADNPLKWTPPTDRKTWFVLRRRRNNLPCEINVDFDRYQSWTELAGDVSSGRPYQFVRWHEHGDISVTLQDTEAAASGGWDTCCAGVVIGESVEAIKSSFKMWAAYVAGEMYVLTVTAPDGNEVCTLGGMYGYGWTMNWARRVIDEDVSLTGVARTQVYGRAQAPRAQELHA